MENVNGVLLSAHFSASSLYLGGEKKTAIFASDQSAEAIRSLENAIATKNYHAYTVDCAGIDYMDLAFVRVCLIPLKEASARRRKVLVLKNIGVLVRESIEAAIAHYKENTGIQHGIIAYFDGEYEVLGKTEPMLMKVFDLLKESGMITADRLRRIMGIRTNNASTRLKQMINLGLVVRQRRIDRYGAYHEYRLPEVS